MTKRREVVIVVPAVPSTAPFDSGKSAHGANETYYSVERQRPPWSGTPDLSKAHRVGRPRFGGKGLFLSSNCNSRQAPHL
jgi:hypothetical protein